MNESIVKIDKLKKVLKVLCILTFIGSTASLLVSIFLSLMNTPFIHDYYLSIIEQTGNNPDAFFYRYRNATSIGIIKAGLSSLTIFGAILMYKIKIRGFYIYALAQLAILFVSPIINGAGKFSLTETIITIIWILLYAIIFYFISKENK